MLDSDAAKSGVLKWLEKPVPLKLRNSEPKEGGVDLKHYLNVLSQDGQVHPHCPFQ